MNKVVNFSVMLKTGFFQAEEYMISVYPDKIHFEPVYQGRKTGFSLYGADIRSAGILNEISELEIAADHAMYLGRIRYAEDLNVAAAALTLLLGKKFSRTNT